MTRPTKIDRIVVGLVVALGGVGFFAGIGLVDAWEMLRPRSPEWIRPAHADDEPARSHFPSYNAYSCQVTAETLKQLSTPR